MSPKRPQIDTLTSVNQDGSRYFLRPASVDGRFTRLRQKIFIALIALLATLPLIEIRGYPAIFIDIPKRSFHFFGVSLGPTDSYLLFFLLTGLGFFLVVVSAMFGRVWCGYACPQTVFLEGVFRRLERMIEGSREAQIKLDAAPFTIKKIAKRITKNIVFIAFSAAIAHLLLFYFVSFKETVHLVLAGPSSDPTIFIWAICLTLIVYFNFAWFREQLCIIICPYGRLQSVLSDQDTIVVGYDKTRGEPRGSLKSLDRGDCIDCKRCVVVCPTGIDIRHGMQLECVGCANCVDACDEVMLKIGQKPGLIRYDSERGFLGQKKRLITPRFYLYVFLGLLGLTFLTVTVVLHPRIPATLIRQKGAPYVFVDNGQRIQNAFLLSIHNKTQDLEEIEIEFITDHPQLKAVLAQNYIQMMPYQKLDLPFFMSMLRKDYNNKVSYVVKLKHKKTKQETVLKGLFLGP